jgi:hypothetical protein
MACKVVLTKNPDHLTASAKIIIELQIDDIGLSALPILERSGFLSHRNSYNAGTRIEYTLVKEVELLVSKHISHEISKRVN